MRSVKLKRSHGDIYVYLELLKQKSRAKQRDNSPAFLTVIPNKRGRLLVTVIEAGGQARSQVLYWGGAKFGSVDSRVPRSPISVGFNSTSSVTVLHSVQCLLELGSALS